ncbi:MAG TPA: glycosyltransferase, partial [Coriobacteriia bacterium]
MTRAIVISPTYNEAENLPALAERLLGLEPAIDVLIVDDASPDGTGAIADGIAAR